MNLIDEIFHFGERIADHLQVLFEIFEKSFLIVGGCRGVGDSVNGGDFGVGGAGSAGSVDGVVGSRALHAVGQMLESQTHRGPELLNQLY